MMTTMKVTIFNLNFSRSWMQIRRIAAHYEEISGHSLIDAINDECHGDTRRAYKAVVRMATDPCYYFARNIYKAMRGLGTDDDCLVRNIIFTSEVIFKEFFV